MALTPKQSEQIQHLVSDAATELAKRGVSTVTLADFSPATKRFLFTKKAAFTPRAEVWSLGVLLIAVDSTLYTAGETTRAVQPGYPGHVSHERERRREFTKVAFESGFAPGTVIYFDSPEIALHPGAILPDDSALTETDGEIRVRWNRKLPHTSTVPLERYLNEQLELKLLGT